MNESKPIDIGFVKVSKSLLTPEEKPKIVNMELDFQNLQNLLKTLLIK